VTICQSTCHIGKSTESVVHVISDEIQTILTRNSLLCLRD